MPVPWYKSPYLWFFVIGCVTITGLRPLLRHTPEPPPVLGPAPAFRMVDPEGRPFGSEELRGQVYIANFFFTSCTSVCPPLMRSVKTLQERMNASGVSGIRLVSVSVDPGTDTPERLRAYAGQLGVDPARWTLLTGEQDHLREILETGFKVPLGERQQTAANVFDIAHTGKLVLVDGQGRIRGYYDSDAMGLDEVYHRSQHVRDQKK